MTNKEFMCAWQEMDMDIPVLHHLQVQQFLLDFWDFGQQSWSQFPSYVAMGCLSTSLFKPDRPDRYGQPGQSSNLR